MKKLLVILSLPFIIKGEDYFVKYPNIPTSSSSTFTLSAIGRGVISQLYPIENVTLSAFYFDVSAITGSLVASDARIDIVRRVGFQWEQNPFTTVTINTTPNPDRLTTATAHRVTNGSMIRISAATTLPTNVTAVAVNHRISNILYACNVTATEMEVATDAGCSSIISDLSGSSGTVTLRWVVGTYQADSAPVANTPLTFTGINLALTGSTPYFVHLLNLNTVPASNYFTIRNNSGWLKTIAASYLYDAFLSYSSTTEYATNPSTGIGSGNGGTMALFTNGKTIGMMLMELLDSGRIYDVNSIGVRFVAPLGGTIRIKCVNLFVNRTGDTTTTYVIRAFKGVDGSLSLVGTSGVMERAIFSNGVGSGTATIACFVNPIEVESGSIIRFLLGASAIGDTSGNAAGFIKWSIPNSATFKNGVFDGAVSLATCNTSLVAPVCSYSDSSIPVFGFIFDMPSIRTPRTYGVSY